MALPAAAESQRPDEEARRRTRRPRPLPAGEWEGWDDQRLLELRMCDLDLRIEGSVLEERIAELSRELEERALAFRPHFWLSDEWFTPDGVAGVAIPFYLAHPRLARLEQNQMLEVEGGTPEWCLRILRHEAGHAIENAFGLRQRQGRRRLFGKTSVPYPEYYAPRPYSKSYVLHLDSWYAQAHPDEDFAETFAVWLTPGSDWRARYAGWPALRKLEYVDRVMAGLKGRPSPETAPRPVEPLSSLRQTLKQHYAQKRKHYGVRQPELYDRHLRRLFSADPQYADRLSAARFLARIRKDVRRRVRFWTGEYQYVIDQVLQGMIERCRQLGLRLTMPEDASRAEFALLLTVQTMNHLHSGRHRLAL
jgi:hypothetical protein